MSCMWISLGREQDVHMGAKDKHLISIEPLHAALGSTRAAVKLV